MLMLYLGLIFGALILAYSYYQVLDTIDVLYHIRTAIKFHIPI